VASICQLADSKVDTYWSAFIVFYRIQEAGRTLLGVITLPSWKLLPVSECTDL